MSSANSVPMAISPVDKSSITVQNVLTTLFLVFAVSRILACRRGFKVRVRHTFEPGHSKGTTYLIRRLLAPFQAFARRSTHSRSQVHSFRQRGGTQALPLHGNVVILVSIPSRASPRKY